MRHTGLLWIGMGVITIVISGCSRDDTNQTSPAEPGARPGAVGTGGAGANVASDEEFVPDVALKSLAIVELSRMALETTTKPDIKSFAQRMIDDHGAAGTMLKSALVGTTIEWPLQLDEKDRSTADELAQKHGTDFERAYLKAMVESHQNLAAKLESRIDVQSLSEWKTAVAARTRSQAMPDPATAMGDVTVRPAGSANESTGRINQWAADTYPVVQKHLDTARTLENVEERRSTN